MLDLLSGIRVVSFNHFLLGPMGIQTLGDLGADVIAVESADGAWQRHWAGGDIWHDGQSVLYLCANRNKRSVAIDLKSARGREIALRLVDTRRRGGRELPARRDGEAGARLRAPEGAQARPDLRLGLGLRPRRPLCRQARPGPAGAGAVRHDGHHRPGGDRTAAGRRLGHRPSRRRAVRHGHPRSHRAAAAHGAGLPGRRQPDAVGARPAGGAAGGLAQRRRPSRRPSTPTPTSPAGTTRHPTASMPPGTGTWRCRCRPSQRLPRRSASRGSASFCEQGQLDEAGRDQRPDRRRLDDGDDGRVDGAHGAARDLARAGAGLRRDRRRPAGRAHEVAGDGAGRGRDRRAA